MAKTKNNLLKNNLLILSVIVLIFTVIVLVIFSFKTKNKPISQVKKETSENFKQESSQETNPTPFYLPIPKNATKLFEISAQNENQQQIWNFLKSKHEIDNTFYGNGFNFIPLVIQSQKSNYFINLSGLQISTTTIKKLSDAVSLNQKIEEKILSLGFSKLDIDKLINDFKIVNTGENLMQTFFYKEDQLFSVFSNQESCSEDGVAGCRVDVVFTNNIEKQIDSQLNVLNKLTDNKKGIYDRNVLSSLINTNGVSGYINGAEDGAIVNGYYIFSVGKYNSDGTTIFAKLNKDNKLDIVGGNSLSDPDYSKISKDTWCSYYGFILNGRAVTDQDSGYIKENCR